VLVRIFKSALIVALVPLAAFAQPAPETVDGDHPEAARQPPGAFMVWRRTPSQRVPANDVPQAGGSALDAAIATELVAQPGRAAILGDRRRRFLLHYTARDGRLEAYDGRETAPAAAKSDRFVGADGRALDWPDAVISGKSVGVPGLLRMLELAHRRHGKLSWPELIRRLIKLPRKNACRPAVARAPASGSSPGTPTDFR